MEEGEEEREGEKRKKKKMSKVGRVWIVQLRKKLEIS